MPSRILMHSIIQGTLDRLHLVNFDLSFLVQRILRSCHHQITFTSADRAVGPLIRWPLSVSGSKYLCREILALVYAEAGTPFNSHGARKKARKTSQGHDWRASSDRAAASARGRPSRFS